MDAATVFCGFSIWFSGDIWGSLGISGDMDRYGGFPSHQVMDVMVSPEIIRIFDGLDGNVP